MRKRRIENEALGRLSRGGNKSTSMIDDQKEALDPSFNTYPDTVPDMHQPYSTEL